MTVPADGRPGDLVFCHGADAVAGAIRFGEWIRWRKGAKWNHVAILSKPHLFHDPHNPVPRVGNWDLIQATGRGVVEKGTLIGLDGHYEIVTLPNTLDRNKVVSFARSQVGKPYGFLTIASIVLNILTPRFLSVRRPGTWICSALGAGALWAAGWEGARDLRDLYQTSPAELWDALT